MDRSHSNWRRIWPGFLISVVALATLLYFVDWQELRHSLSQANYLFLLPASLLYIFGLTSRARAWHILLGKQLHYRHVFLTMNAGYLLNNTLPLRLGELGRAWLLGRRGFGFWRVVSTILIERSFDMLIASGLTIGTLPIVFGSTRTTYILIVAVILMGLSILYFLARYQEMVLKFFDRFSAGNSQIGGWIRSHLGSFLAGLAALKDPLRFTGAFGWMVVGWTFALGAQFLLIRAFLPQANLLWAAVTLGISALGVAVPSSPGYLGIYEAALVGALSLFGVSFSTALAYAFISHIQYLLITGIIGAYALIQEGEALGSLYRNVRRKIDSKSM
ncbi:MAG: lysylphosphatidylglycerol synthase transmembrane domain-containing protein [Anaerolineales bacterium]